MNSDTSKVKERTLECVASSKLSGLTLHGCKSPIFRSLSRIFPTYVRAKRKSWLYNSAIKTTRSVVRAVWRGHADSYYGRGEHHRRKAADSYGSVGGVGNHPTIHNGICL
jgi:hypothetical protein